MANIFVKIIVLVLCLHNVATEIHRAKPAPQKAFVKNSHADSSSSTTQETSRTLTWIYSLGSAGLVGLSGIFPLLVIPIESGPALKHGAPAARLKLLLAFAVGGLLGDVFLHLLPEAWAHLDKGGHDHTGHTYIGMWIIAGILTFLIIEKIFSNESEFDMLEEEYSDNEESDEKSNPRDSTNNGSSLRQRTISNNNTANGKIEGDNSAKTNTASKSTKNNQQNIKVSGWLNLSANCIDNFTHGLAVGGSYIISTKVGLLTTFAILVHEIPHEIGDFAILLRSGFDRWKAAKAQLATASGGILGAMSALLAESAQSAGDMTAWILPFTSGGFIYIALVTVVPDLLQEKHAGQSLKQIVCLVSGIAIMGLVTAFCE